MNPTTVGALWIVSGMSLIALSDNFVAGVAREMGLWQFHMLRSAMVVPVAGAVAVAIGQGRRLWPAALGAVILRSLFATLAMMMYFTALPAVGIAPAAAGLFTSPIWVALFSALLFGERIGPRRVLGAAVGFLGVVLVLGVGAAPVQPMALVAVAGGASWALNVIWTRRFCAGETAICLAAWSFAGMFAAGLAGLASGPWLATSLAGIPGTEFATLPWRPLAPASVGAVLLIGLAGISATACLAQGYKAGAASVMGLFDFAFLFWAPFFAWALWGEVVSGRMALGMGLIVIAGALALWSGARTERGR